MNGIQVYRVELEDGTGSRRPCWRCGSVAPPDSALTMADSFGCLPFALYEEAAADAANIDDGSSTNPQATNHRHQTALL